MSENIEPKPGSEDAPTAPPAPPPGQSGAVKRASLKRGIFHSLVDAVMGSIGRGWRAVRGLFGKAKRKRHARVYWDEDITLTLANLVHESETQASGKVQIISLAEFRASIADLWDRYESRIIMIAETSIARRIGRGNTFIALDEDTWLLLFPAVEENEAQARSDAIARAIGDKLMGARFTGEAPPLPEAAKLGFADVLNPDGSVNLEAVRAQVAKVKAAAPGYSAPIPKSAARLGAKGQVLKPNRNAKIPVARARPLPPTAGKVEAPPVIVEEPSNLAQLKMVYRPAWSADSQSLDTFYMRALTPDGQNVMDSALLNSATALDMVKVGLTAFMALRDTDSPAKFVLPLPIGIFNPQGLVEAQRLIAAVPREDRLGHLRLDMKRLPRANPEKLIALRELFRSYVQGLLFPVDPFALQESMLAIDHVAFNADVSRETSRSDSEIFETLLFLRNRAGLRPIAVTGLRQRPLMARAVAAGISEISGPALMEDMPYIPPNVQALPREMIVGM